VERTNSESTEAMKVVVRNTVENSSWTSTSKLLCVFSLFGSANSIAVLCSSNRILILSHSALQYGVRPGPNSYFLNAGESKQGKS